MYAVLEFGGHLDLQSKYIYANGLLLARYDASPADTHYYHHDGLGSVIGMTNESGSVEQSYFYDEFGNSLGSYGSVTNHYLYTGQEYDGDITSLYNLRARYYDMRIGRFVQEDAMCLILSHPQTRNRYPYVVNNSVNLIDPFGLFCIKMSFFTPWSEYGREKTGDPHYIFVPTASHYEDPAASEATAVLPAIGAPSGSLICVWWLIQEYWRKLARFSYTVNTCWKCGRVKVNTSTDIEITKSPTFQILQVWTKGIISRSLGDIENECTLPENRPPDPPKGN